MLLNAILAFIVLLLVAATFGALGASLRRRGRFAVVALWVGLALSCAAAATARLAFQEVGFLYQPARTHPVWLGVLLAVWLLLTLAPGAAMLGWGRVRSPGAAAARASLLVVPGFLLALGVGLALDVAGINFLPPR